MQVNGTDRQLTGSKEFGSEFQELQDHIFMRATEENDKIFGGRIEI